MFTTPSEDSFPHHLSPLSLWCDFKLMYVCFIPSGCADSLQLCPLWALLGCWVTLLGMKKQFLVTQGGSYSLTSWVFYMCLSVTNGRFLKSWPFNEAEEVSVCFHQGQKAGPAQLSVSPRRLTRSAAGALPWMSSPCLPSVLPVVLKKLLRIQRFPLLYISVRF